MRIGHAPSRFAQWGRSNESRLITITKTYTKWNQFIISNLPKTYNNIWWTQKTILYIAHSLKHRPGGRGLIPEMIQVCDYDILIVLVELNTLI